MKDTLILLLTFLPLTLVGQHLKCCESVNEVETYLSGNWRSKEDVIDKLYQYELNNGEGLMRIFKLKEDDSLERMNDGQPNVKIIRIDNGFELKVATNSEPSQLK